MDKALDFDLRRDVVADGSDFLQRQLTREHNALRAHLNPKLCGLIVEDARLGADMQRQLRHHAFCHADHAEVRDNRRICAVFIQLLQIGFQLSEFV